MLGDRRSAAQLFFRPKSVVLLGASADTSKFGGRLVRNLVRRSFSGLVHVVHPSARELGGIRCVPALPDVPGPVDVAVVTLPRDRVLSALEACAAVGVRGVVVFTSGYGETGAAGREAEGILAEFCQRQGLRLLGPNCLGLFNAHAGLGLTGGEALDRDFTPGPVALVSQSGALVGSVLDRGEDVGVHFAGFVSTGNEADLDASDFLGYLATLPEVHILLAYLEGVKDWERFAAALDTAREAGKPVVVVKSGRTPLGRKTVFSHTGALAGDAVTFNALLKGKGAVTAADMDEALDLALLFSRVRPPRGRGVGIVSVSGGLAGLAADRCDELGIAVPEFSEDTVAALTKVLPKFATARNPLDVTAAVTATPRLFEESIVAAFRDPGVSLGLVLLATVYGRDRLADELLRGIRQLSVPVVAVCFSGSLAKPVVDRLRAEGLAVFESLGGALVAIRTFMAFHGRRPGGASTVCPLDPAALHRVRMLLGAGRASTLTEYESKRVLAAIGLPITREEIATTPDEAGSLARALGFPVALKVMSPLIPHKTRVGGIALGIRSEEEARFRAAEIIAASRAHVPAADIHGVLVQEMVPAGAEAIIGVMRSPAGPLVMAGLGGSYAEALGDVTFRLAPVSPDAAEEMVRELRAAPMFLRGGQVAKGLVDSIVRISWLAHAEPAISELDVNPLMVDESGGCVVVDGLITRREAGYQTQGGGDG